jgi:hypothetical protein
MVNDPKTTQNERAYQIIDAVRSKGKVILVLSEGKYLFFVYWF